MKRLTIIGLVLLTAACAHAPQNAPVRVIVNASDGAAGRVDTSVLQQVTETEISHAGLVQALTLRPLTLTVFFDSFGFVETAGGPANPTRRGITVVSPQAVSNLSATPWEQGLIVQHGDRVEVGSRSNQNYRREVVVGTYTISDDAGNVIEQRPVVVGATNPEISLMPLQIQSTRTTAHYLASRVAAVSR
jgi:hypothetical protein